MQATDRRTFLKGAGLGAEALTLGAAQVHAAGGGRTKVAVIGPGGMGSGHTGLLSKREDVEIAYVCDVDQQRLQRAVEIVKSGSGNTPKAVKDMREVFADKDVEAVFIATPDHWHAPAAILALEGGKNVYVEKPMCHNIKEGRLTVDAVEKSGKKLQVGTQSRSTPFLHEAMKRIQDGEIGEVIVAKAWNSQLRGSIGKSQPSEPPGHLDFDLWLGPAPERPYHPAYVPFKWRGWWDFGTGALGDIGCHSFDPVFRALKLQWPSSVEASSTRVNDETFPLASIVTYRFPAREGMPPVKLVWYDGGLRPDRPPQAPGLRRSIVRDRGKPIRVRCATG